MEFVCDDMGEELQGGGGSGAPGVGNACDGHVGRVAEFFQKGHHDLVYFFVKLANRRDRGEAFMFDGACRLLKGEIGQPEEIAAGVVFEQVANAFVVELWHLRIQIIANCGFDKTQQGFAGALRQGILLVEDHLSGEGGNIVLLGGKLRSKIKMGILTASFNR